LNLLCSWLNFFIVCCSMCLNPNQLLIDPTPKASVIASYLRGVLVIQFIYTIASFIGGNYYSGAFDLIGCFIGFLALRNKEGYAFQQVLCYCVYCAARFLVTIVTVSIAFAASDLNIGSAPSWQFYISVITFTIAPFIFVTGCVLSWFLFKELREVVNEMQQNIQQGDQGYGGGGYQQPSMATTRTSSTSSTVNTAASNTSASGGSVYHPPSVRSEAVVDTGFRPFAGQGHRLGST